MRVWGLKSKVKKHNILYHFQHFSDSVFCYILPVPALCLWQRDASESVQKPGYCHSATVLDDWKWQINTSPILVKPETYLMLFQPVSGIQNQSFQCNFSVKMKQTVASKKLEVFLMCFKSAVKNTDLIDWSGKELKAIECVQHCRDIKTIYSD